MKKDQRSWPISSFFGLITQYSSSNRTGHLGEHANRDCYAGWFRCLNGYFRGASARLEKGSSPVPSHLRRTRPARPAGGKETEAEAESEHSDMGVDTLV